MKPGTLPRIQLARTEIYLKTAVLPDASLPFIQTIIENEFPFPANQLVCAHTAKSLSDGKFEIKIAALPTSRHDHYRKIFVDDGVIHDRLDLVVTDNSAWLVPMRLPWYRKKLNWLGRNGQNVLAGLTVGFVLIALGLGGVNANIESRLVKDTRELKKLPSPGREIPNRAAELLREVVRAVPPAIYVSTLNIDETQRSLHLRGQSQSYAKVSEFVSALSKTRFRGVRAEKSSLIPVGSAQIVEFTVTAELP